MTDLEARARQVVGELGSLLGGGGAKNILAKVQSLGLGHLASSWVGLGKNLPLSPDLLGKVLGNDTIAAIAGKLGLSHDHATKSLAEALPQAIDDMTPDGQPPGDDAAPPDPVALTRKLFGVDG